MAFASDCLSAEMKQTADASRLRELPVGLKDPRLLPFLSVIYLWWTGPDPSEMTAKELAAQVASNRGLEEGVRRTLEAWVNRRHAPEGNELLEVLREIKRRGRGLDPKVERSLVDFAQDLVELQGRRLSSAELDALHSFEAALRIDGYDAWDISRELLPECGRAELLQEPSLVFDTSELTRTIGGAYWAIKRVLRDRFARLECSLGGALGTGTHSARDAERGSFFDDASLALEDLARNSSRPLGCAEILAAIETVAEFDPQTAVELTEQFLLFREGLRRLGSARHRPLVDRIASSRQRGLFLLGEMESAEQPWEIETRASLDAEDYALILDTPRPSARKPALAAAVSRGQFAIAFAHLTVGDETLGVHPILIELRDDEGRLLPGIETVSSAPLAERGAHKVQTLAFRSHRVSAECLLDRWGRLDEGGRYTSSVADDRQRVLEMLALRTDAHVGLALTALAVSRRALAQAVLAANEFSGGQKGGLGCRPLERPWRQLELLPELARTVVLRTALTSLEPVESMPSDTKSDTGQVARWVVGLHALSAELADDSIRAALLVTAPAGSSILANCLLHGTSVSTALRLDGQTSSMLVQVALHLLTGMNEPFGFFDCRRFMQSDQGRGEKPRCKRAASVFGQSSRQHLLSSEFQLACLKRRETHLLAVLSWRLRARLEDGLSWTNALNECEEHAGEAGRAHLEAFVLERLVASMGKSSEVTRSIQSLLASIFSLGCIERDSAWYLEHGQLSFAQLRAARRVRRELLGELGPLAMTLVESFDLRPYNSAGT